MIKVPFLLSYYHYVDHSSLGKWLQSNQAKHTLGKDFSLGKLSVPNSPPIKVVPLNVVSLFIKRQAILGNKIADNLLDGLMNQSLELRLEASLPETSVQVKYKKERFKTSLFYSYVL